LASAHQSQFAVQVSCLKGNRSVKCQKSAYKVILVSFWRHEWESASEDVTVWVCQPVIFVGAINIPQVPGGVLPARTSSPLDSGPSRRGRPAFCVPYHAFCAQHLMITILITAPDSSEACLQHPWLLPPLDPNNARSVCSKSLTVVNTHTCICFGSENIWRQRQGKHSWESVERMTWIKHAQPSQDCAAVSSLLSWHHRQCNQGELDIYEDGSQNFGGCALLGT